ncbi:hypothetical protein F2P81_006757 [Scophthalmus maximus]|uniref:Uncharacterized protein n=1 Tax=Scophthalmus maximus TaxID=52904 RepID=A0A6A4T7M6_SCOMX|nr:hypothetical protein F2P81_006757 [Scophthalmus maximus]
MYELDQSTSEKLHYVTELSEGGEQTVSVPDFNNVGQVIAGHHHGSSVQSAGGGSSTLQPVIYIPVRSSTFITLTETVTTQPCRPLRRFFARPLSKQRNLQRADLRPAHTGN